MQDVVDVLQQGIERGPPTCSVSNRPPLLAKACTNLAFRLYVEVVHQFENHRGTGALTDGVPSA